MIRVRVLCNTLLILITAIVTLGCTEKRSEGMSSERASNEVKTSSADVIPIGGWANLVRVFDWNGNFITSYDLQTAAVGIAVVSRYSEPDILYAVQMRPKLEISRYMLP